MSSKENIYIYYPGCSSYTTEKSYYKTTLWLLPRIGINVVEARNAPCCGTPSLEVLGSNVIRDIGIIAIDYMVKTMSPKDIPPRIITGCSGCYYNLRKAILLSKDKRYSKVEVYHLLEILRNSILRNKNIKPRKMLRGLKIAPFYGCLVLRPPEVSIDDPEDPSIMDDLIKWTGAQSVRSIYRNKCCGAPLLTKNRKYAVRMAEKITSDVASKGADAMVTACNLCHLMLDVYGSHEIPILHITQVLALALGISINEIGLEELYTDTSTFAEKAKKIISQ